MARPRRTWREFVESFWSNVARTENCWVWQGSKLKTTDGIILPRCYPPGMAKSQYAHRVSYEMHFGPIPKGMEVCHRCDNHLCIRPDHLFLGTHAQNMADMAKKGRARHSESNPASKLTNQDVKEIRQLWQEGFRNQSGLARLYGVTHPVIRHIVTGKYWQRVGC